MPRLSTLSNPTGLVEIDRQRVNIVVDESETRRVFSLAALNLSGLRLPESLVVVVIARRGNAESRIELGPSGDWNRNFIDISDVGADGSLRFRLLLVKPGNAKVVASVENIRPDGAGGGESFVALETADLGQRPWDLRILEQEGRVVVQVNKLIYLSSAEAEADKHFPPLVMPEAIRRLANWHVENLGALSEKHWEPFKLWLSLHGVIEEPDENHSSERNKEWCEDVVNAFCNRWNFADTLRNVRLKGGEE
jgi:hypothetical protein